MKDRITTFVKLNQNSNFSNQQWRTGRSSFPCTSPRLNRLHDVAGFLKEEYTKADSIADKETRTNVQNALLSILSHLKEYKNVPPHGIAIFCGKNRISMTGTNLPCTIIEPIEPINIYLFRRSSLYDLEPLRQIFETMNVYGLLVLDIQEAHWGFLRGDQIEPAGSLTANIPNKQRKGGQSALRFQHLRTIVCQ